VLQVAPGCWLRRGLGIGPELPPGRSGADRLFAFGAGLVGGDWIDEFGLMDFSVNGPALRRGMAVTE